MLVAISVAAFAGSTGAERSKVLIRDITTIAGVRENSLVGYGIVVGLRGTGDSRQTQFTTQTLANTMQRLGVRVPAASVRVNNVAGVFVTASLPAFSRSGMKLDVTVSSTGDAKSLEGGILLLTALYGPDGAVYASAQGPLTIGGFSAGAAGTSKVVNHPTVGTVPAGAIVERDLAVDISHLTVLSLMLRDPDFTASTDIANAINKDFQKDVAVPVDSRRIDVRVPQPAVVAMPAMISRIQNLSVPFHASAKVIVNERTGTIVMGGDVKLSPVSVLHGNLSVEVTTEFNVSQPPPFSKEGQTTVVPEVNVKAKEAPVSRIELAEGASVQELIDGLRAIGATARDVTAILQAIKSAGGLRAELEVI